VDAITAIATDHGLDVLNSALKNTATQYQLIGAEAHDATDDQLAVFYSAEIETSYYDDNGVLTFVIELPVAEDFNRYLYAVQITDTSDQVVISAPTPKIALATGVGGMLTLKTAVTGEAGEVIFKASDYITESEMTDTWLPPIHAAINGRLTQAQADTLYVPLQNQRNKNFIINGNFDRWVRGDSQVNSGYSSDDRWENSHSTSAKTHSKQAFALGQTNVPNNPKYYSRTEVISAAIASSYVAKEQKIEGVHNFSGETLTVSFWAKADSNKSIATEFVQIFGTGGAHSSGVGSIGVTTHELTAEWQKFTFTANIPSIEGKTLGTDNNSALSLMFWFDAGSNFDPRTNALGHQSGTFDIAQVQVEKGSVATEFEFRTEQQEEKLCEYYCFKPNFNSVHGCRLVNSTTSAASTVAQIALTGLQMPRMRTTPVMLGIPPSAITLHGESGGTVTTLTSLPAFLNRYNATMTCLYNSADITNVTQMRFSHLPYLDAEL